MLADAGGGAALLTWGMGIFIPIAFLAALAGYFTGRPYREQMRAEFLLDVIESAVREGRRVEQHIVQLAETEDPALGVPFHMLAGYLKRGWTLVPALEKVPALAPPQVCAILKAGLESGNLGRVLPAARAMLRDGPSQSLASVNYQVMLAIVFNPLILLLLPVFSVKIVPVFVEIISGHGRPVPHMVSIFQSVAPLVFLGLIVLVLFIYFLALVMLGGPRVVTWLEAGLPEVSHRVWVCLPWRRKRMMRDFSAMLGLLLDAGLPEPRAVTHAAGSTANRVFESRAARVVIRLEAGEKLTDAIVALDDSGELHWRLQNAVHGAGFVQALAGWGESLDAQAFRQEQGTAQFITTLLLLLNGATVAFVAISIMMAVNSFRLPF